MATILICEPHADVRTMLSFVVRRLGHDPIVSDGSRNQLFIVDAIVVEPGSEEGLALAAWTRNHFPNVAIVCASIFPPRHEIEKLAPDAYLVKPFALYELENALSAALEHCAERRAGKALEQVY